MAGETECAWNFIIACCWLRSCGYCSENIRNTTYKWCTKSVCLASNQNWWGGRYYYPSFLYFEFGRQKQLKETYEGSVMWVAGEKFSNCAFKTPDITVDGNGAKWRSLTVPETYSGIRYINGVRYLSGDKTTDIVRKYHPRGNIKLFVRMLYKVDWSGLQFFCFIAIQAIISNDIVQKLYVTYYTERTITTFWSSNESQYILLRSKCNPRSLHTCLRIEMIGV